MPSTSTARARVGAGRRRHVPSSVLADGPRAAPLALYRQQARGRGGDRRPLGDLGSPCVRRRSTAPATARAAPSSRPRARPRPAAQGGRCPGGADPCRGPRRGAGACLRPAAAASTRDRDGRRRLLAGANMTEAAGRASAAGRCRRRAARLHGGRGSSQRDRPFAWRSRADPHAAARSASCCIPTGRPRAATRGAGAPSAVRSGDRIFRHRRVVPQCGMDGTIAGEIRRNK